MVDGDSCRQRRGDLVRVRRDIAHIHVRRQRRGADERVEQKVGANDPDRHGSREPVAGVAVEEADEDEDERVVDHDRAVADPVGEHADPGACAHVDAGADAHQKRHVHGVDAVDPDQDEGAEGQEYLLPRAIEQLERVEDGELPSQQESGPLGGNSRRPPRQGAQHAGGRQQEDEAPDDVVERRLVGDADHGGADHEDGGDEQISEDMPRVLRAADKPQGGPGLAVAGNLHGDGAADRHGEVFAGAPDHDQKGDGQLIRGNAQGDHADHRGERADPEDLPVAGPVQQRQQEDQQQPRQFPEELEESPLKLVQSVDVHEEVVEGGAEAADADAPDNHAREKGGRSGI